MDILVSYSVNLILDQDPIVAEIHRSLRLVYQTD